MGALKTKTIGFIGAGNMANALIKGLLASRAVEANALFASDVRPEPIRQLSQAYGINVSPDNKAMVRQVEICVLAVKPQNFPQVLEELQGAISRKHLIISIAAGITTTQILKSLNEGVKVIRAMPNTPALVQSGITALCHGGTVKEEDMKIARALFACVGETVVVKEEQMDAVTALSGSGPAYFFLALEALAEGGKLMGLTSEQANLLAIETAKGAAALAAQSPQSLEELRIMVTSPGGTTEAGLRRLEKYTFREALMEAVQSATERSRELSRSFLDASDAEE